MSDLLDAFEKEEGTLKDWGGQEDLYNTALGHFIEGWYAHETQKSHSIKFSLFFAWFDLWIGAYYD